MTGRPEIDRLCLKNEQPDTDQSRLRIKQKYCKSYFDFVGIENATREKKFFSEIKVVSNISYKTKSTAFTHISDSEYSNRRKPLQIQFLLSLFPLSSVSFISFLFVLFVLFLFISFSVSFLISFTLSYSFHSLFIISFLSSLFFSFPFFSFSSSVCHAPKCLLFVCNQELITVTCFVERFAVHVIHQKSKTIMALSAADKKCKYRC